MDTRFVLPPGHRSRPPGSTCCPICPSRCSRRCIPAPRSRSAPTTSRRCSRWRSSSRRCRPTPWIDIPGEVLDILRLWRPTPLVRAARLEAGARHAGAHLLQGRVGVAGRLAQAEHRGAAGVLQQGRGHHAAHDRDRRGPVGHGARVRLRAVRPRVQGVHGARVVRAEAVPQGDHGDVGRVECVPSPVDDPTHPGSLGLAISDAVRDAAHARRHALLARLGAQPRAAAPDGHRARGQGAARARRRDAARRRDRLVRRRLEPRRHRAAVRDRRRRAPRRGRAVVVPDAHRGRVRLRLRRHRRHDAAAADVHARPRLRAAVDPRRRPALPRRLADHLACSCKYGRMEAVAYPQGKVFEAAVQFAGPRARSRRPRPATRIRAVDRRGARGQGDRRGAGDPVQLLAATASSTSPPTTTSTTAASSTPERSRGRRTRVFVKICGITNEDDALLAVALGADARRLRVRAVSRGRSTPRRVRDIVRRLPPRGASPSACSATSARAGRRDRRRAPGCTAAQLHGHETAVGGRSGSASACGS